MPTVDPGVAWVPEHASARPDDRRGGVLLDRDGCLTVLGHHLTRPDDLEAVPGTAAAVATVAMTHRVAVVTNQSVVGRGMVTPDGMLAMHRRLVELFPQVELVHHCPHLPDDGCGCRKPAPGMPLAVMATLGLDRDRTVLVGDNITDVQAAANAGIRGMLVRTGQGDEHVAPARAAGHEVVADAADALQRLAATGS